MSSAVCGHDVECLREGHRHGHHPYPSSPLAARGAYEVSTHHFSGEETPMPVHFRTTTVTIPSGTGRRSIVGTASFPANVVRAGVALNGFQLDYVSDDHHINIVEADTDIFSVSGATVTFRVECDYADKNFDDNYRGYVSVLVIAETV